MIRELIGELGFRQLLSGKEFRYPPTVEINDATGISECLGGPRVVEDLVVSLILCQVGREPLDVIAEQ